MTLKVTSQKLSEEATQRLTGLRLAATGLTCPSLTAGDFGSETPFERKNIFLTKTQST